MSNKGQHRTNVEIRYYLREDLLDNTFILHNIYGKDPSDENLRGYMEHQRALYPNKKYSIWKEVIKTEEALTKVLL